MKTSVVEARVAYAVRQLADPAINAQPVRRAAIEASLARYQTILDGRRVGVPCACCDLPLTEAHSVAAGYGPTCARKVLV